MPDVSGAASDVMGNDPEERHGDGEQLCARRDNFCSLAVAAPTTTDRRCVAADAAMVTVRLVEP